MGELESVEDKLHTSNIPFEAIEKNEYVNKKTEKSNLANEHAECYCDPSFDTCGPECLNRVLNVECIPSMCPVCKATGKPCDNMRLRRKQYPEVEVKEAEGKGRGLFLSKNSGGLVSGDLVYEYLGEVLDYKSFKKRTVEYEREGNSHFYFMSLDGDLVIDATRRGSISRFINHSCNPNCETQKWVVNQEVRVGLFAITDIAPGTEFTFDYQFESYGGEPQKCYCGEDCCSGYIGGVQKNNAQENPSLSAVFSDDSDDDMELDSDESGNEESDKDDYDPEKDMEVAAGIKRERNNINILSKQNTFTDKEVLFLYRTLLRTNDSESKKILLRTFRQGAGRLSVGADIQKKAVSVMLGWFKSAMEENMEYTYLKEALRTLGFMKIPLECVEELGAVAIIESFAKQFRSLAGFAESVVSKWNEEPLQFTNIPRKEPSPTFPEPPGQSNLLYPNPPPPMGNYPQPPPPRPQHYDNYSNAPMGYSNGFDRGMPMGFRGPPGFSQNMRPAPAAPNQGMIRPDTFNQQYPAPPPPSSKQDDDDDWGVGLSKPLPMKMQEEPPRPPQNTFIPPPPPAAPAPPLLPPAQPEKTKKSRSKHLHGDEKRVFRRNISEIVVNQLVYMRRKGKVTMTDEEFKSMARKVTHDIMAKETPQKGGTLKPERKKKIEAYTYKSVQKKFKVK